MTTAVGVSSLGTYPLAGTWARAKPSVTITDPGPTFDAATITECSITYSSPVSRAKYSHRIQIRTEDGSTVLYDTGVVVSAATSSLPMSFILTGGSTYQLWVRASDLFDTSDWATQTFTAASDDPSAYPVEEAVGSVYEVGINGVGYMLADGPELPVERQTTLLDPPRFTTGDTPFSEAVERYSFIGSSDWSSGAGQRYLDRPDSVASKFWDSEGVDPFEDDNAVCLLPDTIHMHAGSVVGFTVAQDILFYRFDASNTIGYSSAYGRHGGTFTIAAAGNVDDLASDGYYWYACDGANVFRGTTTADPGAAWSTVNAEKMCWALDRLAVVYDDGTNYCVSTLDGAGAEEVVGGRFKYPNTSTVISDLVAGDGYLWFATNRESGSEIRSWQVDQSGSYAAVALTFPSGQRVSRLGYYLGNVFVHTYEVMDNTYRHRIYRCVPNSGTLIADLVVDYDATNSNLTSGFAGDGRFVYFAWAQMTEADHPGIGAIDLSTGGYAKWNHSTEAFSLPGAAEVLDVAVHLGQPVFAVEAHTSESGFDGVYTQDYNGGLMSSGWLKTSISDKASSLDKVLDEVRVTCGPLPAGGSFSVEYSFDNGDSYTSVGDTVSSAGARSGTWDVGLTGRSIGLKVVLGATSTNSPKVVFAQAKIHPVSARDEIVAIPVNCSTQVAGLNGQTIPYETTGVQRLRTLQSLVGARVKFQDVDWPTTNTASIWDLVGVRAVHNGTFDRTRNRRVDQIVAVVTLRRGV